jgi:hypothetical protein
MIKQKNHGENGKIVMSRIKFQSRRPKLHACSIQTRLLLVVVAAVILAIGFLILRNNWRFLSQSTVPPTLPFSPENGFLGEKIKDSQLTSTEKKGSKNSTVTIATISTKGLPSAPAQKGVDGFNTSSHHRAISKKSLPSFQDGGFIFFLHVPKTGGSTIRWTLEPLKGIQYGFVSGNGGYTKNLPAIEHYFSRTKKDRKKQNNTDIWFLEIHGRDSPNLVELRDTLLRWKRMAAKNTIPTFFFTVLRDPLSYALSYFNFFHVQRANKYFERVTPVESNLLRLSLNNPQCQFLSRGELSLRQAEKQQPTREECQHVEAILYETMDWVGSNEQMSAETLPLLSRLLNLSAAGVAFEPQRVSMKDTNNSISMTQLRPSALAELKRMTVYDQHLYTSIQTVYSADIWEEMS